MYRVPEDRWPARRFPAKASRNRETAIDVGKYCPTGGREFADWGKRGHQRWPSTFFGLSGQKSCHTISRNWEDTRGVHLLVHFITCFRRASYHLFPFSTVFLYEISKVFSSSFLVGPVYPKCSCRILLSSEMLFLFPEDLWLSTLPVNSSFIARQRTSHAARGF